jgi:hypothetical protein
VQLFGGGRPHLDKLDRAIGNALVHPVQHQVVQADVEFGRRAGNAGSRSPRRRGPRPGRVRHGPAGDA